MRYERIVDAIADAKRTITAGVGMVAVLLAQGFFEGRAKDWAQLAVAIGTVLGVYKVTDGRKVRDFGPLTVDPPEGPAR